MSSDVLVRAEGVSKKYSRNLMKSLWYGVKDTLGDLAGRDGTTDKLRPSEFWALNNVSFELRRGQCLGLIGRNGAGKTTLLKLLTGLIKPDNGRIEIRGRLGALIALGAGFNPVLSGRENIYVNAAVLGLSRREINEKIDKIIDFADIDEFIDAPVQSYSSGMVVRLGFAVATATEPDVLLLDEVLAVGDVGFQAKCFNTLAEFRKRGTAFILVSHNMHAIAQHCDQVIYVRHGIAQYIGNVDDGIAKFLKDSESTDTDISTGFTDWSRTYGSGKVKLLNAYFLNSAGKLVQQINAGEAVSIVIEYERCAPKVSNAVIDLVIRDRSGIVYQGNNDVLDQSFGDLPDKGKFRIDIDALPANVSRLEFSLSIFDRATREFFDWKRQIRLGVTPSPLNAGTLVLRTKWSVTT